MKILLLFLLSIFLCSTSAGRSSSSLSPHKPKIQKMLHTARNLIAWFRNSAKNPKTFIGRCFGIGGKLKIIMPLIIFKLGVIVTILIFLTIFSLKSLAMLGLLVVINFSGLISKWALAKHGEPSWKAPENVHFHLHNKGGTTGYEHDWSDRNDENSLDERLKRLNIYSNT